MAGRVKTENESIYYSIDAIHRAIQENKQISFVYLDWNLKKQLVPRPNGNKCVSPWALIWREENYYLAAYDSEDRVIKHYRVDKMGQAEVTDLPREGVEQFSQIDVTSYTNQTFGMFAGEESVVTMEFPVRLTGVVLDRFGRETDIRPMSEEVFRIRAKVAVSGPVLRMAGRYRTGGPYRSAGSGTKALCTVAFRYFTGTVTGGGIKSYLKFEIFFV